MVTAALTAAKSTQVFSDMLSSISWNVGKVRGTHLHFHSKRRPVFVNYEGLSGTGTVASFVGRVRFPKVGQAAFRS
jgi:hypothetical protein